MSNLPAEMLDHIVDLLDGSQTPLRNCCLVSKSWIPRTRRHLFAEVRFQTTKSLQSWQKTFPDPPTSPARYTKTLFVGCPQVITGADAGVDSWIRSFTSVVRLWFGGRDLNARGWEVAFVLFRAFSPVVKSLRMDFSSLPFPNFFDLVLSFPLLEDLAMTSCHDVPIDNWGDSDGLSTFDRSSNLPVFTGSLDLLLRGGMGPTVHRLLSLPSGIHFRKLTLTWFRGEDISATVGLVGMCSHTLESLDIACNLRGTFVGYLRPHG